MGSGGNTVQYRGNTSQDRRGNTVPDRHWGWGGGVIQYKIGGIHLRTEEGIQSRTGMGGGQRVAQFSPGFIEGGGMIGVIQSRTEGK